MSMVRAHSLMRPTGIKLLSSLLRWPQSVLKFIMHRGSNTATFVEWAYGEGLYVSGAEVTTSFQT